MLEANDPGSFHTVVIRPSGIFGPEDATMMRQALRVVKEGKTGVQIGRNTSLADFTYVDNVVHGHLLAADHIEEDGVHGEVRGLRMGVFVCVCMCRRKARRVCCIIDPSCSFILPLIHADLYHHQQ